jgi:hypothetical protein
LTDLADRVTLDDNIRLALLVVLEQLSDIHGILDPSRLDHLRGLTHR